MRAARPRHAYDPWASAWAWASAEASAKTQGGLASAWAQARPGLGLGLGLGMGLGPGLFPGELRKQPQNNYQTTTKQRVFISCFAPNGGFQEEVPKALPPLSRT